MITCKRAYGNGGILTQSYFALSTDEFDALDLKNGDDIYLIDSGLTIYYDEKNAKFYDASGNEYDSSDNGGGFK